MQQRADDVDVRVPVRDHYAFWSSRRAAGVVNGEEVELADLGFLERGLGGSQRRLIIDPALAATTEGDEVPDIGELGADRVDLAEVIGFDADHGRPAVFDDVQEVGRGESVVHRDQHGADLRDGIERLQLAMGVRRDVDHPVTLLHAKVLERRRPAVRAVEELAVRQAQFTVDNGLAFRVEPAGSASEL